MTTVLVTHAAGAHLASFSAETQGSTSSTTTLPLPSRFPTKTTPQTAVAPSGHIFLWATSCDITWEYDSKGRRVGEIAIKSDRIKRVLGLGKVEGKETVVVDDGTKLQIWAKSSAGKWDKRRSLDVSV